ncbi:hypothetical protein ES703_15921 [subsurface metagenome]
MTQEITTEIWTRFPDRFLDPGNKKGSMPLSWVADEPGHIKGSDPLQETS